MLCNKGIRVNLYNIHFLSSHFSSQLNKKVLHPFHFCILPTKHKREKTKSLLSSYISILSLFHSSNQTYLKTFFCFCCIYLKENQMLTKFKFPPIFFLIIKKNLLKNMMSSINNSILPSGNHSWAKGVIYQNTPKVKMSFKSFNKHEFRSKI